MVAPSKAKRSQHHQHSESSNHRHRLMYAVPMLVLVLYLAVSLRLEGEAETEEMEKIKEGLDVESDAQRSDSTDNDVLDTPGSIPSPSPSSPTGCNLDCDHVDSKRTDSFGGDLADRTTMLNLATKARDNVIANIRKDYGIYFDDIFKNGFEPITPDGESVSSIKRKLQIKALTVQTNVLKEKKICENECRLLDQDSPSPIFNSTIPHYTRYVWATGGHSASAGHGNLFNESYTAFMERDLQPIFASIGIEFEGRNYAMGGTKSGLEISMCFEQVFGSDVDFFSWDYGMTDGRKDSLLFHYGRIVEVLGCPFFRYRGALSPGHPGMLGVWTNGWKGRTDRLEDLEELGVPVFHRPKESIDAMNKAFPDSGDKTEEELAAMPAFVRHFKCQEQIEKGEPHCQEEKYTKGLCDHRTSQVSWHPGFKQHGLDGHMLALFLSQLLLDALRDLVDHSNQDPTTLLAELNAEENDRMKRIQQADLPSDAHRIYDDKSDEKDPAVDLDLLYKGPSMCHIARTPALTRYLGYLTNTSLVGGIAPFGQETYDTGTEKRKADDTNARGELRLVWEYNSKDRQSCEVPLRPDYKDFFYAHERDGAVKLTFPNEMEKAAYNFNPSKMKGLVILFLVECDWGKCPDGNMKAENIAAGDVIVKVNGITVSSVLDIGSGCIILKNGSSVYWEQSPNGDYEVSVKVNAADAYLRISSIVVY
eukprot:scaffold3725_cov114-Cylindrotheca_fusiformis.AAC.5